MDGVAIADMQHRQSIHRTTHQRVALPEETAVARECPTSFRIESGRPRNQATAARLRSRQFVQHLTVALAARQPLLKEIRLRSVQARISAQDAAQAVQERFCPPISRTRLPTLWERRHQFFRRAPQLRAKVERLAAGIDSNIKCKVHTEGFRCRELVPAQVDFRLSLPRSSERNSGDSLPTLPSKLNARMRAGPYSCRPTSASVYASHDRCKGAAGPNAVAAL